MPPDVFAYVIVLWAQCVYMLSNELIKLYVLLRFNYVHPSDCTIFFKVLSCKPSSGFGVPDTSVCVLNTIYHYYYYHLFNLDCSVLQAPVDSDGTAHAIVVYA